MLLTRSPVGKHYSLHRLLMALRKLRHTVWAACVLVILTACGVGVETNGVGTVPTANLDVTITGTAQKGPFVKGSRVLINHLSENGDNTYETAVSAINDDLGNFQFPTKGVGPILIEADGINMNEITGSLSQERLQLRAIYNVTNEPTQRACINVLTHLAYKRILKLLSGGITVDVAIRQSEAEVIASLLSVMPISNVGQFTQLSLFSDQRKSQDGDAYLLALSAIVYQYATNRKNSNQGVSVDSQVPFLLNTLADEIAESGQITNKEILAELRKAMHDLKPDEIAVNLSSRIFDVAKVELHTANMNLFVDTDGDGTVNQIDKDDDNDGILDENDERPYTYGEKAALIDHANSMRLPSMQDVILTWEVSNYAKQLDIEFAQDRSFTADPKTYYTESRFLVIRFDLAGKYFVRARSKNHLGAPGEWSDVTEITVGEFSKTVLDDAPWDAFGMISTYDGGFIITGRTGTHEDPQKNSLGRIIKLDGQGTLLWDYTTEFPVSEFEALALSDNSIVAFGTYYDYSADAAFIGAPVFPWLALSKNGELKWQKQAYALSTRHILEHEGNLLTVRAENYPLVPALFRINPETGESARHSAPLTFLVDQASEWGEVYGLMRVRPDRLVLSYATRCNPTDLACGGARLSEFNTTGELFWTWKDPTRSEGGRRFRFDTFATVVQDNKFILGKPSLGGTHALIDRNGNLISEVGISGWRFSDAVLEIRTSRQGRLLTFSSNGNGTLVLSITDTERFSSRMVEIACNVNTPCKPIAFTSTSDGGLAMLYRQDDKQVLKKIADADKF